MRELQRLEAIGRLAGGVAHDFNNILSVILTFSSLLEAEAPEVWREDLAIIREAALRGADLTKQLLALGGHHVMRAKTLELSDVLARMEKMLRRIAAERLTLSIELAPDLWPVRADAASIEQIILSLVVNARDAMSSGGELTISASNVEHPLPHVRLSITQTGPIEQEELAILLGLVKHNGGTVRIDGGLVELRFPKDVPPAEVEATSSVPSSGEETVLLVDDDSSVRGAAAVILRRGGHHVLEAANPSDAITISERYRGPIHLLLTEVLMPRVSGYELAARLMFARPTLRVLYTSDQAILEGTVPYLEKPFTPESLIVAVRRTLTTDP